MSLSIPIPTFPLDFTGRSYNNRVLGEYHELGVGEYRTVVPTYGAYYTEYLVVRDASTGNRLTVSDDYIPVMYYEEPSIRSGKEICAGIIVFGTAGAQAVTIDYQAVGGEYESIESVMNTVLEEIDFGVVDQVKWGDIFDRPEAFKPLPHLHGLYDVQGFDYVVYSLERIRQALLYGDVGAREGLKEELMDTYKAFESNVKGLLEDYQGPGKVFLTLPSQAGSGTIPLNGQTVQRADYPELFDLLSIPSGTDTYTLPSLTSPDTLFEYRLRYK